MSSIDGLISKVKESNMKAIALTDHGTMYGIREFHNKISDYNKKNKENPIMPILGVETYVAQRSYKINNKSSERIEAVDKSGWHLILLAKNKKGYYNLCKLMSEAYINGYYGKPRIDKELLEKFHDGIIVSSACLGGEIPQKLLGNDSRKFDEDDDVEMGNEDNIVISKENYDHAEEAINWFKNVFHDDFYLEIQRHKTDKEGGNTNVYKIQQIVNRAILELAKKTNTKIIATNDVHFVEENHAEAHDRLICLSTNRDYDDPKRMHYTKQEWLKTPEEMYQIFSDIPEVLQNTMEIVDKIEYYELREDPMMPEFDIPEDFATLDDYRKKYSEEDLRKEFITHEGEQRYDKIAKTYEKALRIKLESDYLTKLAYDGAKLRYGDPIPDSIVKRLDEELNIMKTMGFPGYFLIVQDFIKQARKMGVLVGPGRGSAAGSVVSYCLTITNIDPIPYNLLFERFLNPDRITLPDIDIDFDDAGRGRVLQWVTEKYGKDRVAHIVTYGTMGAKSSIKDVARVHKLSLSESDRLSKLVPSRINEVDERGKAVSVNLKNCFKYLPEFKEELNSNRPEIVSTLSFAEMLEGTVRQVGVHACGVIIGAQDLSNCVPLSFAKDKDTNEDILVTQYEGKEVEGVGLIKMDFLGLKTLSIISSVLKNIKKYRNIDIDIDNIPIDDIKTYELYGAGNTVGTFQFESDGMRKYLKDLQPTKFEDLIAMNALYRPGPIDKIPDFIERKHGRQAISYPFLVMENYLKDTYGITIYQEQVMLLSRELAGFTRGKSDELRKVMGKKDASKLPPLHEAFIKGAVERGYDEKKLEKIWEDWAKFAEYAFNKSHATCYSWVAYQTAYLKANYPTEFMAALLTHNLNDIKELTKFIAECKRMEITVHGPNVNESFLEFTVKDDNCILFGMAGIKNLGTKAVEAIIEEREKNGKYKDVFDLVSRVESKAVNKKAIETLAYAGAFDCFDNLKRYQYFTQKKSSNFNNENSEAGENTVNFIDDIIAFGNAKKNASAPSLFENDENAELQIPKPYDFLPFGEDELLHKEKEVVGLYLSGHPLDIAKIFFDSLKPDTKISELPQREDSCARNFSMIVYVTDIVKKTTKSGMAISLITVSDYEDEFEFSLFGKDYDNFFYFFNPRAILYIKASYNKGKSKGEERIFFNLNSVIPVIEGNFKQLNLRCDLSLINQEFLKDFEEIQQDHKNSPRANTKVRINVYDKDNNEVIDIISHYNFALTEKFIKFVMKYFPEGNYSIEV